MMKWFKFTVIWGCFTALFLACYAPALFGDRQFSYRDAAHYYYPLYQRVQNEWDAGRWPLWEPEENAGMPLLGNPTAAVLYPFKLVFAFLPYAWGARVYVMLHTALAFAAMRVLMRSWQTSWVGSTLAAMSYAFGMPVLFQYSNIIYLVGAAWLPLGFCALDRWVRLGQRRGLLELAIVLAMQILGGDLQSAYLLGGVSGLYAVAIACNRRNCGFQIADSGLKAKIQEAIPNRNPCPNPESLVRIWNPDSGIPSPNLESGFPSPNLESGIRNLESGFPSPNLESGIQNLESGIPSPNLKSGFPSPNLKSGFPIRNLESGIRYSVTFLTVLGVTVWVPATLALARWLPQFRPSGNPPRVFPWMPWVPTGVAAAWGIAGLGLLVYGQRRGWRSPLVLTLLGLGLSSGLAITLAAAQLLPCMEYLEQTARAAGPGRLDIYRFSIEPFRLVELIWPNILGLRSEGNTYWIDAVKLPGVRSEVWVPSLYLGGLTLILGSGALALRQGPPWRVGLSALVVVSLFASLGPYSSPLWVARIMGELSEQSLFRDLVYAVGPLDPAQTPPIRIDRFLRDGDGGFYWLLATALPGFQQFRYPAKLYTLTAIGLAALAGLGWDSLRDGRSRKLTTMFASILVLSLATLIVVWIKRPAILALLRSAVVPSLSGPLDAEGGFHAMIRGLLHASIVSGLGLVLVHLAKSRPQFAGVLALLVMMADLAVANARYVLTVPQSVLDTKPKVLQIIEEAERKRPSAGPFRIHRMPAWHPPIWQVTPSTDRGLDYVIWEHDTLQPKYGIHHGIAYTHTFGVGQLYDYDWFFDGFPRAIRTREAAKSLGMEMGQEVMSFPRRSFDLWNTRYFVIPANPIGWRDPLRGHASFLFETEPVYPEPGNLSGSNSAARDFLEKDFQVRRNTSALPRAWVVHQARWIKSSAELSLESRNRSMLEMIYADDPIWHDPRMSPVDPRAIAWLDHDKQAELVRYLQGGPPSTTETVQVTYPTPQRVELVAALDTPGLVILSDVDYPGWQLTIDGQPAPIYKVNRIMRGAAVDAGTHRLIYSYEPRSFFFGRIGSIVGFVGLVLLGAICALWPAEETVAGND